MSIAQALPMIPIGMQLRAANLQPDNWPQACWPLVWGIRH
jgi:hypothetical protein